MAFEAQELEKYYSALEDQRGYDAACRMALPPDMLGLTVVDVACRKGKGVYKISDQVGPDGVAIGLDWRADKLADARAGAARAVRTSSLEDSNMRFVEAYPEQIADVLDAGSVDIVYVNSVMNVFYDVPATLKAFHDVLKHRGLLVCDTVIASARRDADVIAAAKANNNAVQSAVDADTLIGWLGEAGFALGTIRAQTLGPISPEADCEGNLTTPLAPSEERVDFAVIHIQVRA